MLRHDVVHCHQQHVLASSLSALWGRLTGRRVFVTEEGGGGWDLSAYVRTDGWYRGHLHLSRYSLEHQGHGGDPSAHVIYGGVDTEKFSPPADADRPAPADRRALFVGRLMAHKGIIDLIHAARPDVPTMIFGRVYDAGYRDHLHQAAEGADILFRENVDDDALVESYRRALCVVLPSVYRNELGFESKVPELLGQTLLEGMSCGLPGICTDVASMPEVVEDGVTGFVVPPNDPPALREKLQWLRATPTRARRWAGPRGRPSWTGSAGSTSSPVAWSTTGEAAPRLGRDEDPLRQPEPADSRLSASKHLVELAEEMSRLGWQCDFLQPADLGMDGISLAEGRAEFARRLRDRLRADASGYDVVEYNYKVLPFPRSDFPPSTLLVARSVLLELHMARIRIPQPPGWRRLAGRLIRGPRRLARFHNHSVMGLRTLREADLVTVNNAQDRDELARRGIDPAKVRVHPCGIDAARRARFDAVPDAPPPRPTVGFVGSFDYRKGAGEFPALVAEVLRQVPEARFRLLGTSGLFRTADQVLALFPDRLRPSIEVRPTFEPDELPDLLAGCTVGVFPSHLEGFGLGVLEMLAAAVPVVAYDTPGPPMMLPPEFLVPRGDAPAMAAKVAALLRADPARLRDERRQARQRSRPFRWDTIARQTSDDYQAALAALRGTAVTS